MCVFIVPFRMDGMVAKPERHLKNSYWDRFFTTYADAKQHVIEKLERDMGQATSKIDKINNAKRFLETAKEPF
jgi:hypothetical protein